MKKKIAKSPSKAPQPLNVRFYSVAPKLQRYMQDTMHLGPGMALLVFISSNVKKIPFPKRRRKAP